MAGGTIEDERAVVEETYTNKPAVGIVATVENSEQVPARILRARQHGHDTIVAAGDPDCEGIAHVHALDAAIVTADEIQNGTGLSEPRRALSTAAHVDGYPGLLYHPEVDERVDFTASNEEIKQAETFTIETRTEPPVEDNPDVLVGIPAYNEESTIGGVVRAARKRVESVVVVNDGSDDETVREAQSAGATVVSHKENQGYGAALQTIFDTAANARADQLIIIDGDGQHDIGDAEKLIETQRETDAEIVIGSRFGEGGATEIPLYRRFGLGVINLLTNLSMGMLSPEQWIRDTQSGFRAYNSAAINTLAEAEEIGDGMDASLDILYQSSEADYQVEEVPVTIDYSVDDASSQDPISHGITLVTNIVETVERKRPITLLGLPGFTTVLVGLLLSFWTFSNYINSGSFPFGVALGASVFTIAGFLASFTAIILHSLSLYHN